MLRQQLIVASRGIKRPDFRRHERGLLVLLTSIVARWRDAILLVKPDTILRWHREGFRLLWRWRSRPRRPAIAQLRVGERHLLHVLREYAPDYFNEARPHQGLGQRIPVAAERRPFSPGGSVVAVPLLGGLHHDCRMAA
jgi:hypothetical protein